MNLKSKATGAKGFPKSFAYLIAPAPMDLRNNAELYTAVKANGQAVLRPFDGASFDLLEPVTVSPEEFEKTWEGD